MRERAAASVLRESEWVVLISKTLAESADRH
jgi:hypothetical protein